MANEANSETEVSKTELILSVLAEQGPKTEYDLYKQFPKLSHGTIHFCLNKLAHDGSITYTQKRQKKKHTKKLYYLTFIGTVTHIAGFLYWHTMQLTDSQIEEHLKRFREKDQGEIIEFLYKQGRLLKYPLFEESKWLAEHFSGIASVFVNIADIICNHPPLPFRNLLVVAAFDASGRNSSRFLGEKASEVERLSREELIELEQDAFRREFKRLFFEFIVFMRHNGKATTNLRLLRLVEEAVEDKRGEIARLELAVRLFDRQAKQK